MQEIPVVGAVIVLGSAILCAQRNSLGPLPLKWEFPGGKVEPGEEAKAALEREILEELGCTIAVGAQITSTTHTYEFGVVSLTTFFCTLLSGVPQAKEHETLAWISPSDLTALDWAPADVPTIKILQEVLS